MTTKQTDEIYVSTDVETDGPIPGDHSMLSLGSAAFTATGHMIDAFSANLLPLPDANADPNTAQWWASQPEALAAVSQNQRDPRGVMAQYVGWLKALDGRPVFVAYPAGFDFMFVYWYIVHFGHKSPFSFSALDMKTYAMAKLGTPYRESAKGAWPGEWRNVGAPHTHLALDDAIEQGRQFIKMLHA